jgi:hypothetical protein
MVVGPGEPRGQSQLPTEKPASVVELELTVTPRHPRVGHEERTLSMRTISRNGQLSFVPD